MKYEQQIKKILKKNNGLIETNQLDALGIPRVYLARMVKQGVLKKIQRGLYCAPDTLVDAKYVLQRRFKKIVYSHDTALNYWDLGTFVPIYKTFTVPYGYKLPRGLNLVEVHYVNKEIYKLGITTTIDDFGNKVFLYNQERTIADCLKDFWRQEGHEIKQMIQEYQDEHGNIDKILEYAKVLKVDKEILKMVEEWIKE